MSKNYSKLSERKGLEDSLFEKIGEISAKTGTPSLEEMQQVADDYLLGKASVYGTASFYDFTREANKGKKAYVCNGSACLVAGTQDELKNKLEKHLDADEVGEMCCLGRCHENAAFHYEGNNYSAKSDADIASILSGENKESADTYHTGHIGPAILTAPFPGGGSLQGSAFKGLKWWCRCSIGRN